VVLTVHRAIQVRTPDSSMASSANPVGNHLAVVDQLLYRAL
jgi:hypothetical protein